MSAARDCRGNGGVRQVPTVVHLWREVHPLGRWGGGESPAHAPQTLRIVAALVSAPPQRHPAFACPDGAVHAADFQLAGIAGTLASAALTFPCAPFSR